MNPRYYSDPIKTEKLILRIKNHHGMDIDKLFIQYLPLVKLFWRNYYLHGMEFDDWKQEAIIVMLRSVQRYSLNTPTSFGAFYRSALRNRFFDMIRKQNAQKRIPTKSLVSLSANIGFYSDTVTDKQAPCPEKRTLVKERLIKVYNQCSKLEKSILVLIFRHKNFNEIAEYHNCSVSKIVNAFERCKVKFVKAAN